MTNTIPNVPRELLERAAHNIAYAVYNLADKKLSDLRPGIIESSDPATSALIAERDIRALLSAPSPAGVDGLEVTGWYTEDHLDDKSATTYSKEVAERWLAKGWPITGIANADDAQAIIDGLRGEVAAQRVKTCTALKERNDAREQRDQLAGLLRDIETHLDNIAEFDPSYAPDTVPLNTSAELLIPLRALLSAPSPAGVDGLEVVGYLLTKGNQLSRMPAGAADEPLCSLSDAQAIIEPR